LFVELNKAHPAASRTSAASCTAAPSSAAEVGERLRVITALLTLEKCALQRLNVSPRILSEKSFFRRRWRLIVCYQLR